MQTKKGGFLSIRISDQEKSELKKRAEKSGLSLSAYLIQAGLNKSLPKKLNGKELEIYSALMQFKTNFSRISNLIKSMEQKKMLSEISIVIEGLNRELKKIKNDKQSKIDQM